MSIAESRLLQLALERLESQKRNIDAEIAELRARQDYGRVKHRGRPRKQAFESTQSASGDGSLVKKKMSAAHRRAISQAMKERWANRNKEASLVN